MMRCLPLLVVIAGCLVNLNVAAEISERPPQVLVRLGVKGKRLGDYAENSTLEDIFDGSVKLFVKVRSDSEVKANFTVFVNERCFKDGHERKLGQKMVDVTIRPEGSNFSLSDISTKGVPLPCGPNCLFVKTTIDGFSPGIASVGLKTKCPPTEINLELKSAIQKDKEYNVKLGESLKEQIPALDDLKLKNNGPGDARNKLGLDQSVLVFARKSPLSHQDIVDRVNPDCLYDEDDMKGSTPRPTVTNQPKPNPTTESPDDKELGDGLEEVEKMYYEWQMQRDVKRRDIQFPRCIENSLLQINDVPLRGGDIQAPDDIPAGSEINVDLRNVSLELVRGSLCAGVKGRGFAQIVIVADPLRMNNDSDLCNNAIVLNITYTCDPNNGPNEYETAACDVMVNPLSRGQKAKFLFGGEVVLEYNGEAVQAVDSDKICKDIGYHRELTELLRYRFLADRFQRMYEFDRSLCEQAEEYERGRERELIDEDIEEDDGETMSRKKRALRDLVKGVSDQINAEKLRNLTTDLKGIEEKLDEAMQNEDTAKCIICVFESIQIKKPFIEIPEDAEFVDIFDKVNDKIDEIQSKHKLFKLQCQDIVGACGLGNVDDFKVYDGEKVVKDFLDKAKDSNDTRYNIYKRAYEEYQRQREKLTQAEDGDAEDRFKFFEELLDIANGTCPGRRGQSIIGNADRLEQLMILGEKSSSAVVEDLKRDPLPNSTCGIRILQEYLSRGAASYINTDTKIARIPSAQDTDVDKMRFIQILRDEIDNDPAAELDAIKQRVHRRMNESKEEEEMMCGPNREGDADESDDTFNVYWKRKDGKILMGVPDIFDDSFGSDEPDRKRFMLWKPVATCFCSGCGDRDMITPNMGFDKDEDSKWDTKTERPMQGSTTK